MSYDLDALHQKYGIQVASIRFATVTDVAGLSIIAGTTSGNQAAVIHQISFVASAWTQVQLGRSTAAASAYWVGYAGQTQYSEPVRIICDNNASVIADLASVGVTSGSGVLRVWFSFQKSSGTGLSL